MKTILKSLSRDYVAIYTDATDTSKFCVGSIAGLDNQYVLLKTVDEDGRDDGYTLRAIETIYAVEENTQYLSRITELSKRFVHSAMINLEGHPSMLDALGAYAQSEKEFVSVELNSSGVFDVSGYIFKANEEIWEICQVDSNGVSNGRIYVSKEAISRVDCGSNSPTSLWGWREPLPSLLFLYCIATEIRYNKFCKLSRWQLRPDARLRPPAPYRKHPVG